MKIAQLVWTPATIAEYRKMIDYYDKAPPHPKYKLPHKLADDGVSWILAPSAEWRALVALFDALGAKTSSLRNHKIKFVTVEFE